MFGPFFDEVKTHKQKEKHGGVDTVAILIITPGVPWWRWRLTEPIFGRFLCFSLLCVLAGSIYSGRRFNLVVMSTKRDFFLGSKGAQTHTRDRCTPTETQTQNSRNGSRLFTGLNCHQIFTRLMGFTPFAAAEHDTSPMTSV